MRYKPYWLTQIINSDNVNKLICPFMDCEWSQFEGPPDTGQTAKTYQDRKKDMRTTSHRQLKRKVQEHVFRCHISKMLKFKKGIDDISFLGPFGNHSYLYYKPNGGSRRYHSRVLILGNWEKEIYKLLGKRNLRNNLAAMKLMGL